MNKYNAGLLATIILCSAAVGLVASETRQEKPFFDRSTQEAMKRMVKAYVYTYAGMWGLGTAADIAFTTFFVKKDSKMLDQALSPWDTIKKDNRVLRRTLLRSTLISVPICFGYAVARHKYEEHARENQAKLIE